MAWEVCKEAVAPAPSQRPRDDGGLRGPPIRSGSEILAERKKSLSLLQLLSEPHSWGQASNSHFWGSELKVPAALRGEMVAAQDAGKEEERESEEKGEVGAPQEPLIFLYFYLF